ncbi:hypothetical protein EV361DRAFT_944633 [Lentinula raphanica]|nr:hypothetical protein EV361DRAFT_944633 [Lentinula raphanica]
MSRSTLLESFDPFAVHPFTSSSCLAQRATQSPKSSQGSAKTDITPESQTTIFVKPQKGYPQGYPASTKPTPVFVPFRKETGSVCTIAQSGSNI